MKPEKLDSRTFRFAKEIVQLSMKLRKEKHYDLASQLLRSGTSIGANIREAQAGSSFRDFTNKMTISSKEARETQYWLDLIDGCSVLPDENLSKIRSECNELVNILTTTVKTSQAKLRNKPNPSQTQ